MPSIELLNTDSWTPAPRGKAVTVILTLLMRMLLYGEELTKNVPFMKLNWFIPMGVMEMGGGEMSYSVVFSVIPVSVITELRTSMPVGMLISKVWSGVINACPDVSVRLESIKMKNGVDRTSTVSLSESLRP